VGEVVTVGGERGLAGSAGAKKRVYKIRGFLN